MGIWRSTRLRSRCSSRPCSPCDPIMTPVRRKRCRCSMGRCVSGMGKKAQLWMKILNGLNSPTRERESIPRRRALPISFEPIDSGTIVEALLNGQMLSRGTSTAEREALSISAAWLQDAADNQAIGIKLRGGSFAVRGDGQSYLEIIVLREVNVNIR